MHLVTVLQSRLQRRAALRVQFGWRHGWTWRPGSTSEADEGLQQVDSCDKESETQPVAPRSMVGQRRALLGAEASERLGLDSGLQSSLNG